MLNIKYNFNKEKLEKAAYILKTLAHPTRLAIVDLLNQHGKVCVNDIANLLNIEQSLLSHHLITMRLKGILTCEKEGQSVFYALKEKDVTKLIACIENCHCNM
jgi:ArsR family transcriptional regulator